MGLDKFSAGSFEEMAEQNEAAEVKTPAEPQAETASTVEAEIKPCDCSEDCPCEETPKTE
jgi:hypothetical protein